MRAHLAALACCERVGPALLSGRGAGRALVMELAAPERIAVFGRATDCDVLRLRLTPGLGLSPADDADIYIARDDRLMRRVRFTLNGLDATQGAVAEVDTADHIRRHGVAWPTRFHERLIRPAPIPVHDWPHADRPGRQPWPHRRRHRRQRRSPAARRHRRNLWSRSV